MGSKKGGKMGLPCPHSGPSFWALLRGPSGKGKGLRIRIQIYFPKPWEIRGLRHILCIKGGLDMHILCHILREGGLEKIKLDNAFHGMKLALCPSPLPKWKPQNGKGRGEGEGLISRSLGEEGKASKL